MGSAPKSRPNYQLGSSSCVTCMMEDSLRQERRDKQAAPLDSAHPDDHRVVLSGSWPPRDANSPCARPPKSRDILGEEGGKKEGGGR